MSLIAALCAAASLATAAELPIRFQPEPDFEPIFREIVAPLKAKDAFAGLEDCAIVDAKTLRPFAADELEKTLAPCAAALASRYGAEVSVRRVASSQGDFTIQIEGIAFYVPANAAKTDPVMRDLEHGISRRGGRLLGHPAFVRRAASRPQPKTDGAAVSVVQSAVDSCLLPAVVRRIESAAEFIKLYGRCIRSERSLQVRELAPSPAHALGVNLLSDADEPVVRSLNGSVTVETASGPVRLMVVAYPQKLSLP